VRGTAALPLCLSTGRVLLGPARSTYSQKPDRPAGKEPGYEVLVLLTQLATWPRIHVARADLLARMGRDEEAARAYRTALELEPPAAERRYIQRRLARD